VESQTPVRALALRMIQTYCRRLDIPCPPLREWQRMPTAPVGGYSLAIAANVLNELPDGRPLERLWAEVSGTFLILEPGHRVSSQKLIRLRERLREEKAHILGPCAHEERCPLVRTKHWCHFSEPVGDEQLIKMNRALFGDNRPWLKFSYLFLSREAQGARAQQHRAIGDLHLSGPGMVAIDLCAPDDKKPLRLPRTAPADLLESLVRGSLVTLSPYKADSINEVQHLNSDEPAWQRKNHRR
jgi:ribosomal protein RSM22 (predicted rRNA methylase)